MRIRAAFAPLLTKARPMGCRRPRGHRLYIEQLEDRTLFAQGALASISLHLEAAAGPDGGLQSRAFDQSVDVVAGQDPAPINGSTSQDGFYAGASVSAGATGSLSVISPEGDGQTISGDIQLGGSFSGAESYVTGDPNIPPFPPTPAGTSERESWTAAFNLKGLAVFSLTYSTTDTTDLTPDHITESYNPTLGLTGGTGSPPFSSSSIGIGQGRAGVILDPSHSIVTLTNGSTDSAGLTCPFITPGQVLPCSASYGGGHSGTYHWTLEPVNVAPTDIGWDTSDPENSVIHFKLAFSGPAIPYDSKAALYWSSTDEFADAIGGPIPDTTVTIQGFPRINVNETHYFDANELGLPPKGATHLLIVTDPDNVLGNFDQSTNVAALVYSQVTVDSLTWNKEKGGVDFSYTVRGDDLQQDVSVAFYWDDFTNDTLKRVDYFTPNDPVPGFSPDSSGKLVYTIPAGTKAQDTPYPDVHIPGNFLKGAPDYTTHLMVTADPNNTLGTFDTSQSSRALKLTLDVPPLYQYQGPWAPHSSPGYLLGRSQTDNIERQGCSLLSLVMALNYAGVTTDPIQLNKMLRDSPNGYDNEDTLNWGPATAVAAISAGQYTIRWHPVVTSDPQELRDLITSTAAPVIVSVFNPTTGHQHFVLVTGLERNTFTINDPGYSSRTTLGPVPGIYGNSFETRGYVADPPDDLSALYFAAAGTGSGPDLTVTDPNGNVTGLPDGGGPPLAAIPKSVYFTDGPLEDLTGESPGGTTAQFVYVTQPAAGAYGIRVSGAAGPSGLEITDIAPDGAVQSQQSLPGPGAGGPGQYQVILDSAGGLHPLIQLSSGAVNAPGQLPADTEDLAYGQAVSATGGSGTLTVTYTVTSGTIPPGLTFIPGPSALSISGTPTAAGTVTFAVTATDNAGDMATQTYTLAVNPPVGLSPATLPDGVAGSTYNQTVPITGGTGPVTISYTVTAGAVPAGLRIATDGSALSVAGVPSAAGSVTFQVTATDSLGSASTQTYSLIVDPGPSRPVPQGPTSPAPPAPSPPPPSPTPPSGKTQHHRPRKAKPKPKHHHPLGHHK